jgi:hypothetical protein
MRVLAVVLTIKTSATFSVVEELSAIQYYVRLYVVNVQIVCGCGVGSCSCFSLEVL